MIYLFIWIYFYNIFYYKNLEVKYLCVIFDILWVFYFLMRKGEKVYIVLICIFEIFIGFYCCWFLWGLNDKWILKGNMYLVKWNIFIGE